MRVAAGIVRGNTVAGFTFAPDGVPGMSSLGIVAGNYLADNRAGMAVGAGSTVIGNTVSGRLRSGTVCALPL